MHWKVFALSWIIFFSGLAIELTIDYFLRMVDGNVRTGGLQPGVYYGAQLVLALIAITISIKGSKSIVNIRNRVALLSIQYCLGFILYLFVLLWYVLGFGVDSL